ncbi:MAG: YCF48-related protein, partial [Candidatus Binatia bacterium]
MEEKELGKRAHHHFGLLVAALAFAIGLAGCHGGGHDVPLRDDLITFTDKFLDVAHVSGDVFVIVGYNGRILRTEDGGQSWQEIFSDPAKRTRVTEYSLNQVEFVGEHGWAVGHHGTILHSRDGGRTWTKQQVDSEKTIFSVSFVDALHGRASGDESTFLSTDNGGETWNVQRIEVSTVGLTEQTALAVPDVIYYGIDFVDAQNGWMVGEYGNVRHTTDGGKTWDSQHLSLLDELVAKGKAPARDVMLMGAFFRVHFKDLNNGIIVGAGGTVAVTDNGGQTWRWISREGDNSEIPSVHLYDLAPAGQNGLVTAVGANGIV